MTTWTDRELERIEQTDQMQIAPVGGDGALRTPTTVWVVRDGDDLYVRSYRGRDGVWFGNAVAHRAGHIRSDGVDRDVTFVEEDDPAVNDRIDTAYRTKYRRYSDTYVPPMVTHGARAATLRLLPQE